MSTTPVSEHVKATIGRALGRVPSGAYIMTAGQGGQALAMMVSWVQQAAFNPPAVSVAVQKERPIREVIRVSRAFALAVIGGEGDGALMKKYARGIPPGQDPFEGVETLQTPGGLTVPRGLAWLECAVLDSFDFGGDHELVVARVVDGALLRDGASFTHIRGNGFHY